MHGILLVLHSYLRWAALALAIGVTLLAALAWRRQARQGAGRLGLLATIALDLQLTTGLLLYVWPESIARLAMSDLAETMRNAALRFWAIEHVTLMVLAVAIAHAGRVLARRAKTTIAAHRRTAVSWAISLLLILAAIPWPFREVIGRPLLRF